MKRLTVACAVVLCMVCGCSKRTVPLNDRPCRGDADCVGGQACDTIIGRCVPPDQVTSCTLGTVKNCGRCGDDCTTRDHVGTAACDAGGEVPRCVIIACTAGFLDDDFDADNGCEATCTPTADPTERCDGADNDCDGVRDNIDAAGCTTYYADEDGDGYGDAAAPLCACAQRFGVVENADDCDDDPLACGKACHPGLGESCDNYDDDCNGTVDDEGAAGCTTYLRDEDGDGFGVTGDSKCLCAAVSPYTASASSGGDCNDNPSECGSACHPGLPEDCGDSYDNDCDKSINENDGVDPIGCSDYFVDADGDGYGSDAIAGKCLCAPEAEYTVLQQGDCDDDVASCGALCNPTAREICDGLDNQCGSTVDEGCALSLTTFTTADTASLTNDSISALAVTGAGDLWVGTSGAGVAFYLPAANNDAASLTFQSISGLKSLPIVAASTDAAGRGWFAFDEGACDAGKTNSRACECGPQRVPTDLSPPSTICTDYHADPSGAYYGALSFAPVPPDLMAIGLGTNFGVKEVGTATLICRTDLPNKQADGDVAQAIAADGSNPPRFYAGTPEGLFRCTCADGCGTYTWLPFSANPGTDTVDPIHVLRMDLGSALVETDDRLWVGGDEGLAAVRDPAGRVLDVAPSLAGRWTTADGLPSNVVQAIAVDSRVWRVYVGTPAGLATLDYTVDADGVKLTGTINVVNDTLDVRALALDRVHNLLWIGTASGLVRATIQ